MGIHVVAAATGRGGGQGLLTSVIDGLVTLGEDVQVLGPASPSGLVDWAVAEGVPTQVTNSVSRADYSRDLRRWRREHPEGVLWCDGILPALATLGTRRRVVAFEGVPSGYLRAAQAAAAVGATATIVPTAFDAARLPGASVVAPSVPDLEPVHAARGRGPLRIGFMGEISEASGVTVLADAVKSLARWAPGQYRLRVAGKSRYSDARERAIIRGRFAALGPIVQRVGAMPADEFLGSIDLLVCPAVGTGGFPWSAAAAMGSGVPVIVSDTGPLVDVVGSEHPWVARAGDTEHLAEILAEVETALPASETVDAARGRWARQYSPDASKRSLRELLARLGLLPVEAPGGEDRLRAAQGVQ
ncbi:hypothetical protein GCM10027449_24060 [Sinomonas notoginsengisoli]|uniref:glycosyltransferase n=1 Tax=Sinomonas notoginsengisoli TaxID=1457311 RepID=UPI001F459EDD|nr:glycosyltransferase [Sinomonas notoginsengisoli]